MPAAGRQLTANQAKQLDAARRRRSVSHAEVEARWVRFVATLVTSGVAVSEIARHMGVSRQTVYDWLQKAGNP